MNYGIKEVLVNKSVKNILKIKESFGYKHEIINNYGWGIVVLTEPTKNPSPLPNMIKSKRTSMWYIEKLQKIGKL